MSPEFTNPFINTSFAASSYYPTSPLSSPIHYQDANGAATNTGTVVLYNPSSLYGLYYNENVHGPFATGLQANPFTPGLSPLSAVPKPSYAVEDPLKERFPAMRLPDDPLNWISEDLFNISADRDVLLRQRTSLREQAIAGR